MPQGRQGAVHRAVVAAEALAHAARVVAHVPILEAIAAPAETQAALDGPAVRVAPDAPVVPAERRQAECKEVGVSVGCRASRLSNDLPPRWLCLPT